MAIEVLRQRELRRAESYVNRRDGFVERGSFSWRSSIAMKYASRASAANVGSVVRSVAGALHFSVCVNKARAHS